jgi:hypothetical protein
MSLIQLGCGENPQEALSTDCGSAIRIIMKPIQEQESPEQPKTAR